MTGGERPEALKMVCFCVRALFCLFFLKCGLSAAHASSVDGANSALSKGFLLDELQAREGEIEDLTTQVQSLRRVSLGELGEQFPIRRDKEQDRRRMGRAEFHARTRELGAAQRALDEGRSPLFDTDAARRRLVVEFAAARSSQDARALARVCKNTLASPKPDSMNAETLFLCAVSLSELADPILPSGQRLEKSAFKAFALHGRVRTAPQRLRVAIALVPGYTHFGEPDSALSQLREALLASRADDPWRARAYFVEALLLYQMGDTDKAIDAWRYLSGEKLNTFSGIDFPQEKVDSRTKVLALHQCARAFAARRQWKASNESYTRLLSLPETFQSPALEKAHAEATKELFPLRGMFEGVPALFNISSRSVLLAEAAWVQGEAGNLGVASKLWEASGALPSPSLLRALAKDPSRRELVSLQASQALGEVRADKRFLRSLSSLSNESRDAERFSVLKRNAITVLSVASLHGESEAAKQARRLLARWKPLLVSEKEFFREVAMQTESLLGPVVFLDRGVLERREGIALEVLSRRWQELLASLRRADALSRAVWAESALSEAHANELWRRIAASDDALFKHIQILENKSFRDNHRETSVRLFEVGRKVQNISASLASVRLLRNEESRRQLKAGTVGVVALSGIDADVFRLERDHFALEGALAEVSLEHRLLILSDNDVFPPFAERKARLNVLSRTVNELSGLHLRSFRGPSEFSSEAVYSRLTALWKKYAEAADALSSAASEIFQSVLVRRRNLAGEVQAILAERNAYARALSLAKKSKTDVFERDIEASLGLLNLHLEQREDALLNVLSSAQGARWEENTAKREAVNRSQQERQALIDAYRTSIEMGTAR